VDSGDLSWMLMSTALVVFMVPGLALFYGGMVRSRNVLNMLMMNRVGARLLLARQLARRQGLPGR